MLEQAGYQVLDAAQADEALALAATRTDPIHLLLTDLVMPGMSGRVAWERLSASRREVQVLFMSGYTDDAIVRYGIHELNLPFLQKPFTGPALTEAVRAALDTDTAPPEPHPPSLTPH